MTSVRPLITSDWTAVLRIYGEAVSHDVVPFETEVPRRELLDARWLAGHRWVAEYAGVVVGWAAASLVSTRSCFAGVAETTVLVAEQFQARSVGRTLLQRQITAADEAGLWTLQSSIFPEDIASLELHYAAGFRMVGVRERIARHRGEWRDTVLLERRRQ